MIWKKAKLFREIFFFTFFWVLFLLEYSA